ncbi:hypothetical protein [Pectobacterium carotovorum]|uniref:hypothetical protein n=1 Tax=Pectobacterium carotovorum TaxID=554 RepID=UPI001E4C4702|nr:hypothetical protein [Pectobacterium carotovorum]UFT92950.1 hypothetical protein LQF52_13885 [Pectobacterium carotovorum]
MRLIFGKSPKFNNRFSRASFFLCLAFRQLFSGGYRNVRFSIFSPGKDPVMPEQGFAYMLYDGKGEWITVCCKERRSTNNAELQEDSEYADRFKSLIGMLNIPFHPHQKDNINSTNGNTKA